MEWGTALSLFDRFRQNKPATTVEEDRPLSEGERTLAERLLRDFSPPPAFAFLGQLDHARITGRCTCGCPTVDISVPTEFRIENPPLDRPLVDAFARVDGKLVGVMLFQTGGLLSLLEIYPLDDFENSAFGLPAAATLEPAVWNAIPKDEPK